MKIYGRANAWNVRKVLFLAEEIGLSYERLDYGRGFAPTNTPEFLALNPNGKVPVLVDGDAVIWESHTILRYLAAKYAPELYPSDLLRRASVDQWLDWKISHVTPAMTAPFFRLFLKSEDFTDKDLERGEADCANLFKIVDGQLAKTGTYIAGNTFTIADCSIGMAVHRWLALPISRPETPHIAKYYAKLSNMPSYQKTVLIGMP